MFDDAYTVGQLDALESFDLRKEALLNARLLGTVAGAGLGAMSANEGERMQGAAIGAAGGYGVGAGVSRVGQGAKGLYNRAVSGPAPVQVAGKQPWDALKAREGAQVSPLSSRETGVGPVNTYRRPSSAPATVQAAPAPQQPMLPGTPALPQLPAGGGHFLSRITPPYPAGREVTAEVSFGISHPLSPVNMGVGTKKERLTGMNQWVPRGTIERAFTGVEQGLDPQAVMDIEAEQGHYTDPLLGSAVGAAAAHYGLPKGGNMAKALGALTGAGLGTYYNKLTEGKRRDQAAQALRGVAVERGFPLVGQGATTASESSPMTVSQGGND